MSKEQLVIDYVPLYEMLNEKAQKCISNLEDDLIAAKQKHDDLLVGKTKEIDALNKRIQELETIKGVAGYLEKAEELSSNIESATNLSYIVIHVRKKFGYYGDYGGPDEHRIIDNTICDNLEDAVRDIEKFYKQKDEFFSKPQGCERPDLFEYYHILLVYNKELTENVDKLESVLEYYEF